MIEFTADANPGVYAVHYHRMNYAMNGDTYPGRMRAGLASESRTDSEQFTSLLDQAGYEG